MLFYNVFAFLCTCINGWLGINVRFNSISVKRGCGRMKKSSVQWSAVKLRFVNRISPPAGFES